MRKVNSIKANLIMEENEQIDNGELVFHYHREERLSNATPTVRDFYEGKGPTPPKGIFEALVHTKASRYSLFALLLVMAFFLGFYFFGSKSYEDTLNGVEYNLSAFEFEDKIYVSIKADGWPSDGQPDTTADDDTFADGAIKASATENSAQSEEVSAQPKISVQICAIDNENQIVDKILFTEKNIKDSYFRTVFVNHDIIKITAEIKDEQSQDKIELSSKISNTKK